VRVVVRGAVVSIVVVTAVGIDNGVVRHSKKVFEGWLAAAVVVLAVFIVNSGGHGPRSDRRR
jgi:hypothetical protein